MNKPLILLPLLLLMVLSPVYAVDEHSGDINIDAIDTVCKFTPPSWYWFTQKFCQYVSQVSDTSNKITAEQFEEGVRNAYTVSNEDIVNLEYDIDQSQVRVSNMWNNIYSLMILLVEILEIVYYLFQLIFLFYLPYLYIKLVTWFVVMATNRFSKRRKG